jgi:hypothetical protein
MLGPEPVLGKASSEANEVRRQATPSHVPGADTDLQRRGDKLIVSTPHELREPRKGVGPSGNQRRRHRRQW